MQLSNKEIVITGGTDGIGKVAAAAFSGAARRIMISQ